MFSAPKLAKTKLGLAPPAPKDSNKLNSSKKYSAYTRASDFSSNDNLCNQSFDTAQALLQKAAVAAQSSTKQQSEYQRPAKASTEFFLMPLPNKDKKIPKEISTPLEVSVDVAANPMEKRGRNAIVLLGKVDFCIKMHKLYSNQNLNALWSVFGKLIKITDGKNRFEQNLLLRNTTGDGPVLKCFFYDFGDQSFERIQAGDSLRVVGRFLSEQRFHVYKVENLTWEKSTEDFSRIQNVISFVLLQKHAAETDDNTAKNQKN